MIKHKIYSYHVKESLCDQFVDVATEYVVFHGCKMHTMHFGQFSDDIIAMKCNYNYVACNPV